MKTSKLLLNAIFIISVLIFTNCSSTKTFVSSANNNEVVIDGLRNEWEGKLNIFGEQKVGVGVRNDDQNLYICVVVADQFTISRIMRAGLVVWLTPNDDSKEIGIKFPIPSLENFGEIPERINPTNNEQPNLRKRFEQFLLQQDKIKIVNKDDFPLYALDANDNNSFQAKIKMQDAELVYELKIPLSKNKLSKYIFNAGSKDEVLCKIETGKIEREMLQDGNIPPRQNTGTNIPGGTGRRGGTGVGMGQGRGGMRDNQNFGNSSNQLEIKFKIVLN